MKDNSFIFRKTQVFLRLLPKGYPPKVPRRGKCRGNEVATYTWSLPKGGRDAICDCSEAVMRTLENYFLTVGAVVGATAVGGVDVFFLFFLFAF